MTKPNDIKNYNHPDENPFKLPDDYFKTLEDKIMSQIEEPNTISKPESILQLIKPWLSMAAVFVLVALLYYSIPNIFNTSNQTAFNIKNNNTELIMSDINEDDLINLLTDETNNQHPELNNEELYSNLSLEDVDGLILF